MSKLGKDLHWVSAAKDCGYVAQQASGPGFLWLVCNSIRAFVGDLPPTCILFSPTETALGAYFSGRQGSWCGSSRCGRAWPVTSSLLIKSIAACSKSLTVGFALKKAFAVSYFIIGQGTKPMAVRFPRCCNTRPKPNTYVNLGQDFLAHAKK